MSQKKERYVNCLKKKKIMYNETITYYSKTPPNKGVLEDADVSFWEENRTCGDDLKVYINIENDIIKKWSFE
jgi:NifU-like protein involved in Fe-S cluster formation